jgi:hypothetical protein
MYTGHIPSPQFLRDAGNAVMGSETVRDLGQGFQHGRKFTQLPGSYLYHGARALGNLVGSGDNMMGGLTRGYRGDLMKIPTSSWNWGSMWDDGYTDTPSLYTGAYKIGQFVRDNPYSAGSIGAGLGLGMAAIAGMSLAARRKRIAALQQILATPPRTRREAQTLAAIAPEIRKEIFVLRNIKSEYRAGFGRVR